MPIDYSKMVKMYKDMEQKKAAESMPESDPYTPATPVKGGVFSYLGNVGRKTLDFGVDVAKGIVKPVAETAIQLPRAVVAGAAGLVGNEKVKEQFSRPVDVPGLGEVKGLSAVPGDSEKYNTQTPGETLAQAAEVGSNLFAAGGAAATGKAVGKGAVKQAALEGLETGAKVGVTQGFAEGIKDPNATADSVAKDIVTGGVMGGAVGAAGGAIAGRASKAGREATKTKSAIQAQDKVVETIMPKVDKKKAFEALRKGEAGVEEATILQGGKVKPTEIDRRVAASVSDYVKPKASPVKNITSINNGIADISENKVAPFLKQSGQAIDRNALNAKLQSVKEKMPLSLKNDAQLGKVYDGVIAEAEKASKNAANSFDLWEARKAFDAAVKREFGDKVLSQEGKNVRDIAIKDVRNALNEHIAETTPDDTFKSLMSKLSDMYTARDRIAEKAAGSIDKNKLQRLLEQYPNLTKIGAGLVGGSAITGGILRVTKD